MHSLRAAWRLARVGVYVLHTLLVVALRWRWLDAAGREQRVAWWAGTLLRLLGITLERDGELRPGAALLVANHISWLDILVVHATCPRARFVAKAEVGHWPLLGWMIGAAGTLFIERERARDALRVVHQMAAALGAGQTVAVFPEGTNGDGRALLPFHANLLQAAIATATPVQPMALGYSEPGQAVSRAVAWVGATTLWQSLWSVARADGLHACVRVLPAQGTRHADRRALAAALRQTIAEAVAQPARAVPR